MRGGGQIQPECPKGISESVERSHLTWRRGHSGWGGGAFGRLTGGRDCRRGIFRDWRGRIVGHLEVLGHLRGASTGHFSDLCIWRLGKNLMD
jgi:hypothetical protein